MTEGLRKKDIVPLPKSHFQFAGVPVERSENITTIGAQPVTELAEKSAFICAMEKNPCMDKITDRSHLHFALQADIGLLGFINSEKRRLLLQLLFTITPDWQ